MQVRCGAAPRGGGYLWESAPAACLVTRSVTSALAGLVARVRPTQIIEIHCRGGSTGSNKPVVQHQKQQSNRSKATIMNGRLVSNSGLDKGGGKIEKGMETWKAAQRKKIFLRNWMR